MVQFLPSVKKLLESLKNHQEIDLMQSEFQDNRLQTMLNYANEIVDDSIDSKVLGTLFDEVLVYRDHYREWLGEASLEYRLATNLLTFSRIFSQSAESTEGKISEWLGKHPLHQEWFERIKTNVEMICTEEAW